MTIPAAILAAAMMSPAEPPPPPVPASTAIYRLVTLPLTHYLIASQVADQRELTWYFREPQHFSAELHTMWWRFVDLADAPPIADAYRLASREQAKWAVQAGMAYEAHLKAAIVKTEVERELLSDRLSESAILLKIYCELCYAHEPMYSMHVRRLSLKAIRQTIGDADYYAGRLPPPAPIWRFHRLEE